jgi:hypothetical protein
MECYVSPVKWFKNSLIIIDNLAKEVIGATVFCSRKTEMKIKDKSILKGDHEYD